MLATSKKQRDAGQSLANESSVARSGQWLLVFFVIATLLRLPLLGSKSLWLDEAFSIHHASRTQTEIWQGVGEQRHPPLYYSGLHEWLKLAGRSEEAGRLPSALFSLLNLGLLYLLGRRLAGSKIALLAVGLLAVSPLDVWYAQEVRMYIFVAGAGLLMALGLTWRNWQGMIIFGAGLILGLYLNYTTIPLWVGLSAVWLAHWWLSERRIKTLLMWLTPSFFAWWLYQPWLPHLQRLLNGLNTVTVFARLQALFNLPEFSGRQYLLLLALIGLGLTAAAVVLLQLLRRKSWRHLLAPVLVLAFALLTVVCVLPRFYTVKRILVTGWPLLILFITWLIVQMKSQRYQIWLGLMGLSLLATLFNLLAVPKDDWRSLTAYLNQHSARTAVVWLDPGWNQIVYNYYRPYRPPQHGPLPQLEEVAVTDVWLVVERYPGTSAPGSPSEAWLDTHLQLIETIPFYRLELRHYRP